ncbi:MAG: PHP domain-containing protein [Candidatus Aenigmatarchaeota archaeon]
MVYADLHVHTTASDGLLSLEEVIKEAKSEKLGAIAVTDHDTVNPNLKKRVEKRNGLEVVSGTEIKAIHRDTKIEILCYFVDPSDNSLQELFDEMRGNRINRMKEMVERFNSMDTGIKLGWKEIVESAGGPVGRPHFARAIANKGLTQGSREAFDKYAKEDKYPYVSLERPDAKRVIELAHDSSALTSLAHPCTEEIEDFESFLDSLVDLGLDCCETYYPYSESPKSTTLDPEEVKGIIDRFGLFKTGGSDFHNRKSFKMGAAGVSRGTLEEIKEAVGV